MAKNKQYIFVTILSTIFVVFIFSIILGKLAFIEVDKRIELTKSDAQEILEGIKCEFTYKDLHYNGSCTKELIDSMQGLVEFDRTMELLKVCTNQPYAYRWELCEDLKVR